MAKLYFRYGVVGAAKTLNLIAVHNTYKQQGKVSLIFKPAIDERGDATKVTSRNGSSEDVDALLDGDGFDEIVVRMIAKKNPDCILVDEAQFLSKDFVDSLRHLSYAYNIPVICYGLKTDFQKNLFPGSKRLLEVADSIEEVKTTCKHCNSKAIYNIRLNKEGKAVFEGPQVLLGWDDTYEPVCHRHYSIWETPSNGLHDR